MGKAWRSVWRGTWLSYDVLGIRHQARQARQATLDPRAAPPRAAPPRLLHTGSMPNIGSNPAKFRSNAGYRLNAGQFPDEFRLPAQILISTCSITCLMVFRNYLVLEALPDDSDARTESGMEPELRRDVQLTLLCFGGAASTSIRVLAWCLRRFDLNPLAEWRRR